MNFISLIQSIVPASMALGIIFSIMVAYQSAKAQNIANTVLSIGIANIQMLCLMLCFLT